MIIRLFQNKIFAMLCVIPVSVGCLSLLTIPIHRKEPSQLTSIEQRLVTPNPTLHQLAIDRDYLGFATYNTGYPLACAIFYLALSGLFDSVYQEENNRNKKS